MALGEHVSREARSLHCDYRFAETTISGHQVLDDRGAMGMGETMTEQIAATAANRSLYDASRNHEHVDAAPHLMHASLRTLHDRLIADVFRTAATRSNLPRILDLGAGEGTAAEAFLHLGGEVIAVDISERQLSRLQQRCAGFGPRLQVYCEDVWDAVKRPGSYDVIVVNSFLHHVPDYLGLIAEATKRLKPGGQFFSFQDPLRYDTLGRFTYSFSNACYLAWRIFQGSFRQGVATRIRRMKGIYLTGSKEDDAEYHVTRNGVDQVAIAELLRANGYSVQIIKYFSTQSPALHRLGSLARLENTFGIVAQQR